MRNREEWIADTLVELADMLAPTLDPVKYLLCVADRYSQLITSSSVRLTAMAENNDHPIVLGTDERLEREPLGELLGAEGPGTDCRITGEQIVDVRLDEAGDRWEKLVPAALSAGFQAVHAFPLSRHHATLGSVTILTTNTDPMPATDVRIAKALADVTTISLLNHRAVAGLTETTAQLEGALSSRVIIEQAKGLVSARLEVGTDDAFLLMRRYARSHNLRIAEVSGQLISRRLRAVDLPATVRNHQRGSAKAGRR